VRVSVGSDFALLSHLNQQRASYFERRSCCRGRHFLCACAAYACLHPHPYHRLQSHCLTVSKRAPSAADGLRAKWGEGAMATPAAYRRRARCAPHHIPQSLRPHTHVHPLVLFNSAPIEHLHLEHPADAWRHALCSGARLTPRQTHTRWSQARLPLLPPPYPSPKQKQRAKRLPRPRRQSLMAPRCGCTL